MRRSSRFLVLLAVPLCVGCGSSSGFSNNKGDSGPGSESGTPPPDGATQGHEGGGGPDGMTTTGKDGSTGGPEGSTGTDGGGSTLPTPSTGITITVEPDGSGDAAALLTAIQGAKTAVHVEMYLLTNSTYIDALISLAKAGKDVKVILNQTFPTGTSSSDTNGSATSGSYAQLKSGGVAVGWGPPAFTYTHEKAVIIDPAGGSDSQVWIMTMNLDTDAPKYNREFLALDTNAADIAEAEAIFEEDFGTSSGTPSGNLVVAPSPPNNAVTVLVDLINSATTSIQLESEEFDDSGSDTEELVFKALAAKAGAGVSVELVLEDSTDSEQTTAVTALQAAGGKVVGYPCSASLDIHAKALVVDGTRAYVGSENFSGGSLGYNRELGVYFTGSGVSTVASTITKDFAGGSTYSATCSE
jgi:phosphatidylserine/phosphatidylglycerophosphate/cardiolipin synthase-like enzyme